jgi:hypothetical protein
VEAGYRALASVPPEATVVAQGAVLPHLSQRRDIRILTPDSPDADFIVAAAALSPWPAERFEELAIAIDERRRRGFVAVFEEEGWIVLRRP